MSTKKVLWSDVRTDFYRVNPLLASKIDDVSPCSKFPLFVASFPYGDLIGDDESQFIPKKNSNEYYRLNDPDIPNDIKKHLGYGKESAPLGMILDKSIEFFIDAPERGVTIPTKLIKAGEFFNFSRILSPKTKTNQKPFAPNGLLKASSGARTIFSLPYLTCSKSFSKLAREVSPLTAIPTKQYDHWQLFKDIYDSQSLKSPWEMKLLFFTEKWVDSILNDKKWAEVKFHIFQSAWDDSNYKRNQYFFDVSFSMMKAKVNGKNPYSYDTARHLLDMAVGAFPGLAPETTDDFAPVSTIQYALAHFYGLTKYIPTIITPKYFSLSSGIPVYYSMHHPTVRMFSPKSNIRKTALDELDDLSGSLSKVVKQILSKKSIWEGTILKDAAEKVSFKLIHHYQRKGMPIIKPSKAIKLDDRFLQASCILKNKAAAAADGNFFRGCVSLQINP